MGAPIALTLALAFVPAFSLAPAAAGGEVMRRVFLDDSYSVSANARCLDGTRPAYYIKPSATANASKYVVYFQGGGWCYTLADCAKRATGALGSSASYPATSPSKGGIVDPDPLHNPNFHDWNLVWVPYCDGTSWSGNQANPVFVQNKTIWYRGRANMRALVAALSRDQGMRLQLTFSSTAGAPVGSQPSSTLIILDHFCHPFHALLLLEMLAGSAQILALITKATRRP